MKMARRGDRGRRIRALQVILNTRLVGTPRLRADGIFGPRTETAVRGFQRRAGLTEDGLVGGRTWSALLATARVPSPALKKFQAKLGTVDDFVHHLQRLEHAHSHFAGVLAAVSNFHETPRGTRYLLITPAPHVIDFRHFFAAAAEAHGAAKSRPAGLPLGGSRGEAMLLGVANEIGQCIDEATRLELNSCFAAEDLGSNRLGAEFGRSVAVAGSEASRRPVSRQLRDYLERLSPNPPMAVGDSDLPGPVQTGAEALWAVVVGILDVLIPDVY